MVSAPRRWYRNPLTLVLLVAALSAFVIQSGELGTSDTSHRLQTTHSWWTSEPPVRPYEYPEFGIHGRGGKLYSWYGMGQSLLMFPADVVGTGLSHLPIFANYNDTDPTVRAIFVSYTTNILVNVLTALICFRFLCQLGFSIKQSVAGVLALLFCTTHLHYAQNMMENNYIMLLTLTGFSFQYEWLRTGSRRALLIGSLAFGLNLLTRLTTGLDLIAGGVFLLLVLWMETVRGHALWQRFLAYIETALPIYVIFGVIDRLYQFYRFGSLFSNYITIAGQEQKRLNPSLPANYPWEVPFHVGFLGPLLMPEKSIFLFDPLLVLTILLTVIAWKRFGPELRAYLITAFLLLLAYISFYARYTVWSGDFAWGDRYVSTAVELAAFISVPLLLRVAGVAGKVGVVHGNRTDRIQHRHPVGVARLLVAAGNLPGGHARASDVRRLPALQEHRQPSLLGKMQAWGLSNDSMTYDPWDYVHIDTWNFLPFLLRRVGVAPRWVVNVILVVWGAGLAALAWTLLQLRRVLSAGEVDAKC